MKKICKIVLCCGCIFVNFGANGICDITCSQDSDEPLGRDTISPLTTEILCFGGLAKAGYTEGHVRNALYTAGAEANALGYDVAFGEITFDASCDHPSAWAFMDIDEHSAGTTDLIALGQEIAARAGLSFVGCPWL
jgi:hypothetical protein